MHAGLQATASRSVITSPYLFHQPPPSLALAVSVIVPVRNEAAHLTHTLDALRNQQDATGQALSSSCYEVLVLANNCTDNSYQIALHYQRKYPQFTLHIAQVHLPNEQANIGTVRRLLMDEACRRLMHTGSSAGIIASTDGDTVVDSQWLYYIMAEMSRGYSAVAGRILTYPDRSPARLYHLRDVLYRHLLTRAEARLDPTPHEPEARHHQHFGASFAVTCAMYIKAGRLPAVPYLEDEAFYRNLLRYDARVRKSPLVKVYTSARTDGRVAVGFSEQLRCWTQMNQTGQCQLVEPAGAWITTFANRHLLRQCWANRQLPDCQKTLFTVAQTLELDYFWLAQAVEVAPYFGQLWEQVEQKMSENTWINHWPAVPITDAIQELRAFLK